MNVPLDLLSRELSVDDYVVFHNNIYVVKGLSNLSTNTKVDGAYHQISIMLLHPSKTTRPVKKRAGECCLIPSEDVLAWKLKVGF